MIVAKVLVAHEQEGAPTFRMKRVRGGRGHRKAAKEDCEGFEAKRHSLMMFIGARGSEGSSRARQNRVSSQDGGWKMA